MAETLRRLVKTAAPGAIETIKWAQPVYEANGPFAYFRAFKSHLNFGFWRGVEIDAGRGLLESGGSRMAHLKLRTAADIDHDALAEMIRQAVRLNRESGDPSRPLG